MTSDAADDREKKGESLLLQSFLLASLLAVIKLTAAVMSGSMGIMASALDSGMDVLSSAANYVSYRISQQPPDQEHPYGHGKVESIAGTAQGVIIALAALALLFESMRRVSSDSSPHVGAAAIVIMGVSALVSGVQGWRLRRAYLKTGSLILRAESLHFSMDVLSNLGVMAVLILVKLGGDAIWDILVCLVVAGYVLREAMGLFGESIQDVMDHKLPEEMETQIREIIRSHHPNVIGFHDFRTRRSGRKLFLDFHIEIGGVTLFKEAHEITEGLIDRIKEKFPGADVTVHADPEGGR